MSALNEDKTEVLIINSRCFEKFEFPLLIVRGTWISAQHQRSERPFEITGGTEELAE